MAKQDLVMGAIGGLDWSQVEVWAHSLANCGFKGIGAMVVYEDGKPETETVIRNLSAMGYQIMRRTLEGRIMIERFFHFHDAIRGAADDLRYVVVADVRDVYFQGDPIAWLEQNLTRPFLAVGEGLLHRHSQWNHANTQHSFPFAEARLMDREAYCAGVMAGEPRAVADLFLAIGMVSGSTDFPTADQAAFNLLLDMEPYRSVCQFVKSEDGFACQVGTLVDPTLREKVDDHLLGPRPVFGPDGMRTAGGKLYPIVHQYDRVPEYFTAYRQMLEARLAGLGV